jgi:P27 family predicted phage terminase small subunit
MASEGEVVEHDKQGRIRNPWLQVLREAEATIDKISTKFGMTPMDRTRIKVGGDGKRKDELQDFLSGTG